MKGWAAAKQKSAGGQPACLTERHCALLPRSRRVAQRYVVGEDKRETSCEAQLSRGGSGSMAGDRCWVGDGNSKAA